MRNKNKNLILYILTILLIPTIFLLNSCGILNKPEHTPTVKVDNLTRYDFNDSLKTNGPLTERNLPSKGDVDVLVIPISFNPLLDKKTKPNLLNDIEQTFNGTEEQTGYYSVKEFYNISSYGQLNLNFDVIPDYYKPKFPNTFYENSHTKFGSTLLYEEVLSFYDNTIDYTKYDNDSDGYIDSVWMIYTSPVDPKSDLWWAFVANDIEIKTNDNVKGYIYGFAGTDFIDPTFNPSKNKYDATNIKLDAHTYIHETGHMMGLDDYYDYDSLFGVKGGGTHGLDYMDHNYGDHGPINKLLLDWINPIIVNDICDINIKPYATSGDVYLITKSFKGTIYDSYYLVINYSNDGLYKKDNYFKESGILVYEINALKNIVSNEVVSNGGTYETGFKYDNSDEDKLFVNILGTKPKITELLNNLNLLITKGESIYLTDVDMNLIVNDIDKLGNINVSFK